MLGLFALWILSALRPPKAKGYMDDVSFGQLPVLRDGRLQPMDSVGMNALIQIRGTRKVPLEGNNEKGEWGPFLEIRGEGSGQLSERRWYQFGKHPKKLNASEWLMEVMMHPEIADERYIFAINHPDLLGELGLEDQGVEKSGLFYFTFNEIRQHFPTIRRHAQSAFDQEAALRTPFEKAVIKVWIGLNTYLEFKNTIAPQDSHDFNTDLDTYLASITPGLEAWRNQNAGTEHDEEALDLFS